MQKFKRLLSQHKLILALFIMLLTGYLILILVKISGSLSNYDEYIAEYQKNINSNYEKYFSNTNPDSELIGVNPDYQSGTISNFEGPQVHLKAIRFYNEILTSSGDMRMLHFDPVSANFDPDHAHYGLPNVLVKVQDVRIFQPKEKVLVNFLNRGGSDLNKPYKTYHKKVFTDSTGSKSRLMEMKMYLTEFNVTVDIRPDLDFRDHTSADEKNNTSYPAFWYGADSSNRRVKLKQLRKENKDYRYGDLGIIFEIIPDNNPSYVNNTQGVVKSADYAIAAVYCNEMKIQSEPDIQRISPNIASGQPVFLQNFPDYHRRNNSSGAFVPDIDQNAAKLLNLKLDKQNDIWNKNYYMTLHFNNLGSWHDGLFSQNEYHDQVTFHFIMPVFVVGNWDVMAPSEILPKWDPPAAYIKKFTLKTLLPFWNTGIFGKAVNTVIIILLFILGIRLLKVLK